MPRKRLTIKQEKFCREAVATGNAKEAVLRTYNLGIRGGDMETTARSIATENLSKPLIQQRLTELLQELKIDKNSRLKRLAEILYSEDKRSALGANDQITKILGEYKEQPNKLMGIFAKIDAISEPEPPAEIEEHINKPEEE